MALSDADVDHVARAKTVAPCFNSVVCVLVAGEAVFFSIFAGGAAVVAFGAIDLAAILEVAVLAGASVSCGVLPPETLRTQVAAGAVGVDSSAGLAGHIADLASLLAFIEEMRLAHAGVRDQVSPGIERAG